MTEWTTPGLGAKFNRLKDNRDVYRIVAAKFAYLLCDGDDMADAVGLVAGVREVLAVRDEARG